MPGILILLESIGDILLLFLSIYLVLRYGTRTSKDADGARLNGEKSKSIISRSMMQELCFQRKSGRENCPGLIGAEVLLKARI